MVAVVMYYWKNMRNFRSIAMLVLVLAVLLAYFVRATTKLGISGALFFIVIAIAAWLYERRRSRKHLP